MSKVLVVDDKELMRDSVSTTLQRAGMTVVTAANADTAVKLLTKHHPDAVITDLRMPGTDGLELLQQILRVDESIPVVLMTAYGTVETAVRAMKFGAFDYITKPFEGDELVITVKRALERGKLLRENAVLRSQVPGENKQGLTGLERLIGSSAVMKQLRAEIAAIADSSSTVLICGESGTGKEVVAHAIHDCSARSGETYLAVNCAALSSGLLESELFGHERGAFTGADQLRKGRFELADKGTLLLDEISEIPLNLQAKLLRVLQESAFERVGSSITQSVDVRIVATTNRDLGKCVKEGEFRRDLYYRLSVLPLSVPPLRTRLEDVPELARHFLARAAARCGCEPCELSPGAITLMQQYDWPGNVRELQNICERASVLSREKLITAELVGPWLRGDVISGVPMPAVTPAARESLERNGGAPAMVRRLEEVERDTIVAALDRFNGHRQKTAEALGIGVRTLGLKLKKWKEQKIIAPDL
ncbi:MAG TPA: sigma-54-dependent Fis family transcriptional regulator [Phycisphaeraceae bacterium]|nr:sigma-54-dependent Fis family transcriptional regulator [Phycisphaeraceae bacterium]